MSIWLDWAKDRWDGIVAESNRLHEEDKKRIEEFCSSSQREHPDSNQPGLVESLIDKVMEVAKRPYVIGSTNFNRCSPNVQKTSEDSQREMAAAIKAAQDKSLSPDKLDLIIGEDVFEEGPASETLAASTLANGKEIAESGREKIKSEIETFCKPLTAYLTFYLLHEIVARQKIPLDAHGRPICSYQEMTAEAMQKPSSPDLLWDIYYEHLGKNLSWFALAKVRLSYFLLYSLSNFVPILIRECLTHATLTLHEIVTDEKQLDDRISALLGSIEQYLILLNHSMWEFGKDHGENGNLDAYKANVVHKMFGDHFEDLLDEAIRRKSRELIDQFFPKITFCKIGETNSRKFFRWTGRKVSHYINSALNGIFTLFLKTIILPNAFRSILKKVFSEDPRDVYLFKYKLQKIILEQIQKIDQKLKQPKEKKDEFLIEVKNSKKLETLAAELTKVLWAPSEESPEAIKSHYEDESPEHKAISRALKNGIIKAGRVIIGTLHNPSLFEDSLTKLLSSSMQALLESASRSAPTLSSIKRDYNREKRELALATNKLSLDLTDEVIDDTIDSDLEAFDRRTGRIQERIQHKASMIAESLLELLSKIQLSTQSLDSPPIRQNEEDEGVRIDLVPGEALLYMDHFWTYLQELVQQMNVQGLDKQTKSMPTALKEGLDEALQPLRKQTETIIRFATKFDQIHKDFYFSFALERELKSMLESLQETEDNLKLEGSKKSSFEIFSRILPSTQNVSRLANNIQNFISQEEMRTIEEQEERLIDDLQAIDTHERTICELNSLIGPSGPVAELVLFMQRQSLRAFDSEKARTEIRRVFNETNLNPHLLELIDRMLQFTSRADDADWENLKPMILVQLPDDSPLRERFDRVFEDWKKLGRGENFDEHAWNPEKRRFLQEFKGDPLCEQASSLVDQIEGYLRKNSILNARWNHFCEQVEKVRDDHAGQSHEKKGLYIKKAREFSDQIMSYARKANENQQHLRGCLINDVQRLVRETDILRILVQSMRMRKPYSSKFTLSTAGGLLGAAGGAAATILGFSLGPAVAVGAAVGTLIARNIRPIARLYSEKRIIPHVHEILERAQAEALQLSTRKVLVGLAFSIPLKTT